MKYFKKVEPFNEFLIYCKDNGLVESKKTLNKKDLKNVINECVDRCLKKYLKENISNRYSINEQEDNGVIVYRGMDNKHKVNTNVWVTDSIEYAQYFAMQEYNKKRCCK